jgi:hypothetical protein
LQVAADAVEGVGEFEVGEEVADEGQDHAGLSLQASFGPGSKPRED